MVKNPLTFECLTPFLEARESLLKTINIAECGEPLSEIDTSILRFEPHVYKAAGAPYDGKSPFFLRESLAKKLLDVNLTLQVRGYQLKIFDGYRPLAVQKYMVEKTFREFRAQPQHASLSDDAVMLEVFKIWNPPNPDPMQPPPHLTGGAVDLTIVTLNEEPIDMGSEIDQEGPTQIPDYFQDRAPEIHENRMILRQAMCDAGFVQLDHEWWHFSYGDRFWALKQSAADGPQMDAIYGPI